MAKNNNTSSSTGLGFSGALTIAFIVLKLCGVINWSWWWVLSPIWIVAIIIIFFLIISLILYFNQNNDHDNSF